MREVDENSITIERLATQLNIFRGIAALLFPILAGAIFMVGKWGFAQGSELATLKQTISFQAKSIADYDRKITVNTESVGGMRSDIRITKFHIQNIKETLRDIKELLKESRK